MKESFIRLKRNILHSSLWLNRNEKSIFEAFINILLSVNNKPKSVFINNKCFECGRFQSLKSVSTWANQWNCEKRRAQYYLDRLEKLGYIRIENMKYTTRITVLNAVRFIYLGSDDCKESVYGYGTGKNEKSVRTTGSEKESSSEVVYGKKNEKCTKQVKELVHKGKNSSSDSSSLNSSLNEIEKEKIISENEKEFFEKEKIIPEFSEKEKKVFKEEKKTIQGELFKGIGMSPAEHESLMDKIREDPSKIQYK